MENKKILGLDLGTNSIGWAMVNAEEENGMLKPVSIERAGSRIIPVDAALMGDFEKGNSVSQTADRTFARGARRLNERFLIRRERLNRVLGVLGFLPKHYADQLNRYGQIKKGEEPKLAWREEDGKREFLFMNAFTEMTAEFRERHPELYDEGHKVAYDWTVYYLRKKALSEKLTKEELAWVLMQFNQKRGYNQTRGEMKEDEAPKERKEYMKLRVVSVTATGRKEKGKEWYDIELENGMVYSRQSEKPLEWKGKIREFIVTTKLEADGSEKLDKDGKVKRSLSVPKEEDWTLLKLKTEQDLSKSGKTVGQFIYDAMIENPDLKVIGNLVRTIDRRYYREELHMILRKQMEFIKELRDQSLYKKCIEALYEQNEAYRSSIAKRDFEYLIAEDVIMYQRPLKSKKSLIDECPYEYRTFKDKDGKEVRQYLKCLPKSHPMYEEFRVLQFAENLKIYRMNADGYSKSDCTAELVTDREALTAWMLRQEKVNQKSILKQIAGKKTEGLSWNYVEDKDYPLAPTRAKLVKLIEKSGKEATEEMLAEIWHIMYSVSDRKEIEKALKKYAEKRGLDEEFVSKLKKEKPYAADYGAYSYKATKKLLALMRRGESWSEEAIDGKTRERIEKIVNGEYDEQITERVREKCSEFKNVEDFQGLPVWMAEYVVYGVRKDGQRWNSPDEIDDYLHEFRQHSLNNPIVEQVVLESLRTVRDIWKTYGRPDEIHLEMGRELKKNAAERKQILERQSKNEKANLRAQLLLREFMNPEMEVEGVRPYSQSQAEIFRIYEEAVLNMEEVPEEITSLIDKMAKNTPTPSEVKKYRLWLDQKYRSPYTGQIIPLAKLFTPEYEIEHVIPQSRFFDDSMSNKVICESEVNKLKDRMLAHEFIEKRGGEKVTIGSRVVEVLKKDAYEDLVKKIFAKERGKLEKLMLDDIPEKFVQRQMNDSRYIARLMRTLLNNIVLPEGESEETANRVVTCTGTVTDTLKKDWGVNDVWNHIILPRFERMNRVTGRECYTAKTTNGHTVPQMPLDEKAGFTKKRIDHRHHAMDAIVIACASRNHVNLLSNISGADGKQRYDLQKLLRETEQTVYNGSKHEVFGKFLKPWGSFTEDVEKTLREIIVSFKQNLRVINKSSNHYTKMENGKKVVVAQQGESWSIRKSMHKDTVFGLVNLRFKKTVNLKSALENIEVIVNRDLKKKLRELTSEGKDEKQIKKYFEAEKEAWKDVNLQKIEIYYYTNDTADRYYATRKKIDETFTKEVIEGSVTDQGIQKILLRHLEQCGWKAEEAFSPEGVEKMNENIKELNGGVEHKPIYKVRKYEKANKFAVGTTGVKAKKFVEADKGTILYFVIYETTDAEGNKKRVYLSIPFQDAVKYQKIGKRDWQAVMDENLKAAGKVAEDAKILMILSPGDLVYVPTPDEIESGEMTWRSERMHKFVSSSETGAYFIANSVANTIKNAKEFGPLNKISRIDGEDLIKSICVSVKVDRLGNIISKGI